MNKLTLAYSGFNRGENTVTFNEIYKEKFNPLVKGTLEGADALVLWGGDDIHPSFYKQKAHPRNECQQAEPPFRDLIEWEYMREAYSRKIPIIGVCRGAQFLSVFSGGSLIQDCKGHLSAHGIKTYDGLSIHASANHHQMMHPKEGTYDLLAWSEFQIGSDKQIEDCKPATGGLVDKKIDPEVLWFPETKGLAIQPHPEWMPLASAFPQWCLEQIEHFILKGKQ